MSLTILYHDPERPDEGDMTLIASQATVGEVIDRLEQSGFVIDKITLGYSQAAGSIDPP